VVGQVVLVVVLGGPEGRRRQHFGDDRCRPDAGFGQCRDQVRRDLLVEFLGEAVDHLQQIEAALLALDHEPEDPEALNSIFRSFHTIKGNAGFLGLTPMHTLAHELGKETIAEQVETEAEMACLKGMGVDFVQGYLLDRPAPLPV